ncbi:MAG: peptidase M3 [Bacteroidetes bacterium GWF2_33_16]|nr:MAG: peptidase M3 [Bacteroidetes bacterium GWE2_32_14]OFY04881.1 MAG: peptidase M3 [Bacteroidetes bacterium GWF2_33_16]
MLAGSFIITSCAKKAEVNPLLAKYDTPFEVPPFEKVELKHFAPAFDEAMVQHKAEIEAILTNPEEPTFENTIEASFYAGDLLGKVGAVFGTFNSVNISDSIQILAQEIYPKLSAHGDEIGLDPRFWERVKVVYANKEKFNLNAEQSFLLESVYKGFIRSGANLPADKKEELKKINQELSTLTLKAGQNILGEVNQYKLIIENEKDLAGLPESSIQAAAEVAMKDSLTGKWVFTLNKPSLIPFLQFADNRELRKEIYNAYINQGNNNDDKDNKELMAQIINVRVKRAQLLGYESHAALRTENRMAQNPERVFELLLKLWDGITPKVKQERDALQAMITKEGGKFKLEPSDWFYYTEKLRKEKYDLDENQIRPYFKLENVREGAFAVANKLYGITFTQINNVPLPHPEATAFEVKEADGTHIGLLFTDFHPRPSKRGGAWCGGFRDHSISKEGVEIKPLVTLVCNFTRPSGETPALLSADEVETLFHEFGHALDGLFSKTSYSAGDVAWDFVELPSQIMEHWAFEPEVLKMYATHYSTGEVIPEELIEKLQKSAKFNQGFALTEVLAASLLDMKFHVLTAPQENLNVMDFEKDYMNSIGLIPEIYPRYRSTYFGHIMGGYDAGYYAYTWASVLDNDAFDAFVETSLFDQATAKSFRENVLAMNGIKDAMEMYVAFRGREPKIDALLKSLGIN